MSLLEDYLKIKKSTLPKAGKGLFTTIAISKGTRIVEYKGKIKINKKSADLSYTFIVKPGYVIDAMNYKKGIAQYANDATGTGQLKNINNNCMYSREGLKVYITAIRSIKVGSELLVYYGKTYWIHETVLTNKTIKTKTKQMATAKKAAKKAAPKKAIAKKAAPKKVTKKVAPKKAAPKKASPKKTVAKKVVPSKKGKSGKTGG